MNALSLGESAARPTGPQIGSRAQRVMRSAQARVIHAQQELDSLRVAYADREDLAGLRMLIDATRSISAEIEREFDAMSIRVHRELEEEARADGPEERFCDLACSLVDALDYATSATLRRARRPHGREIEVLIPPLAELLTKLNPENENACVILEGAGAYGHERTVLAGLGEVAGMFSPELAKSLDGMPPVVALTYPEQRESELLGHLAIASEIAHTAFHHRPSENKGTPLMEVFDESAAEWLSQPSARFSAALGLTGDDLEFELSKRIRRMRNWFVDSACDLLALGMVGPALAFALADSNLLDQRPQDHRRADPGMAFRLHSLIAQAEAEYLPAEPTGPATQSVTAALKALKSELSPGSEDVSAEEQVLLDTAFEKLRERNSVHLALGEAHYPPEVFQEELEVVWRKLEAGIPPAERIPERTTGRHRRNSTPDEWSQPMRWQSIINGAYAYWLGGRPLVDSQTPPSTPNSGQNAQEWIDFNSYISGSLELANLHTHLREARDQLGGLNTPRSS